MPNQLAFIWWKFPKTSLLSPSLDVFTGNISRKTIEGVRKATEGLDLKKGAAQGSNKKATKGLKLNKRVTEDPHKNKGVTEGSNKRDTTGSYLAAVKGLIEDLEAKMQKRNLVAKSNMEVNMFEVSDAKASEEAI